MSILDLTCGLDGNEGRVHGCQVPVKDVDIHRHTLK